MASEEKIMSIPKMPPEYELPSLCGANPQFNDVQKKMDDAIKNALDKVEESASNIKAKMETDFAEAKEKFAKLGMPELPSLPDISLQTEMTSIANMDTSTLVGRLQKEAKKLSTKNLFGDALSKNKLDFDKVLSNVESAISGGGDACEACKNFVVKQGGESKDVVEKPQNTKTAVKEGSTEVISTVTTPAVAEGVGLKNIFSFMNGSTPILTDTLGKALKIVGEGGPNMGPKLEELGKENEEKMKAQAMKAGIPFHPGVVKDDNELNQNSSFFSVDQAKVDSNPTDRTDSKDTAFKAETGAQKQLQETTNIELYYNKLMDDFKKTLTSSISSWQRLEQHAKKCVSPYPQNLVGNTVGAPTILSKNANPDKFRELITLADELDKLIHVKGEQRIEDLDREINEELGDDNRAESLNVLRSKWETEILRVTKAVAEAGKEADQAFKDFFDEKFPFRMLVPPAGQPGGPKINKKFTQRMGQAKQQLAIGKEPSSANLDGWIVDVTNVSTHASGLLIVTAKVQDGRTVRGFGPTIFVAVGNVLRSAHKIMTDQFKKQRNAAFAKAEEEAIAEEDLEHLQKTKRVVL